MWQRRFQALRSTVEIRCDGSSLEDALDALYSTYPESAAHPHLSYVVETDGDVFRIYRDGSLLDGAASALDVPNIVELDLFRRVVARVGGCVALHAAAVCKEEKALVMVGPSGAGKTTLTLALLERGWSYVSEECIAISRAGEIYGLARPINLDARPAEVAAELAVRSYCWRDDDDRVQTSYLLQPRAAAIAAWAPTIDGLFAIGHRPDEPVAVERLSSGPALSALWPCVFNPSHERMGVLATILASHGLVKVTGPTVEGSIGALLESR